MSDRFGEVIELDAHRSNFRSFGEITQQVLEVAARQMPAEVLYEQLKEAKRGLRHSRKLLDDALTLSTTARFRADGPYALVLQEIQILSDATVDNARRHRNALIQTVQTLEAAIAASQPTNSPEPAA